MPSRWILSLAEVDCQTIDDIATVLTAGWPVDDSASMEHIHGQPAKSGIKWTG
ncbi:MAG: hypothetical protein NTY87_09680 [Planctomycetia bacterium]|nr:hypothetical protein [Planctomycetia bacterium]